MPDAGDDTDKGDDAPATARRHALSARERAPAAAPPDETEVVAVHPALAAAGWSAPDAAVVRVKGSRVAAPAGAGVAAEPPPPGLYERAVDAAGAIQGALGQTRARVAVILGSGLGAFADALEDARAMPYEAIPGFPRSTVAGHRGRLVAGLAGGAPCLVMQGRFHAYEGWDLDQVTFPIRVLGVLGVRRLVVTNAAGGIAPRLEAGSVMLIADHLNLTGQSPLRGPNDERFGPRFPDMSEAYSERLRQIARAVCPEGTALEEGVYAALPGPQYETPAEIRMLRALGADAVGMSTVPEVTVARHMGVECLGLSGIANKAAGITAGHVLSHAEVVETMARTAERFVALLRALVPALAADAAAAAAG